MLDGINSTAIDLAKTAQIKCVGFNERGYDYDTQWQKSTFKAALNKPKSRILVGSPDIISGDVFFIIANKILEEKGLTTCLLTPFYLRYVRFTDLIKKCNEYDYVFISGLGTREDIFDAVKRVLIEYDIGVIVSYFTYYKDYYRTQIIFREHNPIQYDNEQLGYGAFDSYVFQEKVAQQKELIKKV